MSEIIAISDGLFSLIIVAREDAEVWANQRPGRAEISQSEGSIDSQAAWVAAASISLETDPHKKHLHYKAANKKNVSNSRLSYIYWLLQELKE